ncbi:uncharacterized protein LOC142991482 isoform X2 [Genypterus blacodes]|uniref:uncharacterized protein LOC142991482 isoform X2 n=1 Tax=Genypterus blacodes TaxID=154954 RepID=UPI003F75AABE
MIVTGSSLCLPSPATVQELFSVARDASIIPDISLDPILTSFLSLDSSEALQHQYTFLERSLREEQWRTFSLSLTAHLGGSRVTYGGVGVIALALSMLFDVLAQQVNAQESNVGGPSTHSTQAQKIFGINMSSRIGWIIYSFLQQIPAIANNQEKIAETTELYDNLLKHELLDHFERMITKKRMSSESMQQWLTGSAVHLHMRIHQVRLHSVPSGSAESLRLSYKTGLFRLVQSYTAYLRRNIHETEAGGSPGPQAEAASGRSQTTANTSSKIKVTCLGGKNSSESLDNVGPSILNDMLNDTTRHNSNESSDPFLPHATKESEGSTAGTAARKTVNNCNGDSRHEEGSRLGLLVVEPQRNVSHNVHHHPCESPAIEQALVTRIIAAQDLQRNRYFFLNSERVYRSLLRQKKDFAFNSL